LKHDHRGRVSARQYQRRLDKGQKDGAEPRRLLKMSRIQRRKSK